METLWKVWSPLQPSLSISLTNYLKDDPDSGIINPPLTTPIPRTASPTLYDDPYDEFNPYHLDLGSPGITQAETYKTESVEQGHVTWRPVFSCSFSLVYIYLWFYCFVVIFTRDIAFISFLWVYRPDGLDGLISTILLASLINIYSSSGTVSIEWTQDCYSWIKESAQSDLRLHKHAAFAMFRHPYIKLGPKKWLVLGYLRP